MSVHIMNPDGSGEVTGTEAAKILSTAAGVITAPSLQALSPRLNNAPKAGLIYGPSDTGKTSQIGFMAKYIWKKYGKRTRLISADGGGWAPLRDYIELGIIQPVSLMGVDHPGEWLKFLFEGFWPVFDEKSGKWLKISDPKCAPTSKTWDEIGAYGIEGLYSISTYLMQHHSHAQGSLEGMAGGAMSKDRETSIIKDGMDIWTQPGIGFYNFVLQKMGKYAYQSSSLPVHKVLWTSLIDLFEKKDKQQNVIESGPYGPAMVGKQGIKIIPQWFGDLIHMDIVTESIAPEERPDREKSVAAAKVGTVNKKVRAYLKSHTHPKDGILCPAKPRVSPSQYHELPAFKDFTASEGFMDWYYGELDRLSDAGVIALRAELGL